MCITWVICFTHVGEVSVIQCFLKVSILYEVHDQLVAVFSGISNIEDGRGKHKNTTNQNYFSAYYLEHGVTVEGSLITDDQEYIS